MKKETIRRSVSLPTYLDNRIKLMAEQYSYKVKNDLIIELLELGLIKFNEDNELKNTIYNLVNKVERLINQNYE